MGQFNRIFSKQSLVVAGVVLMAAAAGYLALQPAASAPEVAGADSQPATTATQGVYPYSDTRGTVSSTSPGQASQRARQAIAAAEKLLTDAEDAEASLDDSVFANDVSATGASTWSVDSGDIEPGFALNEHIRDFTPVAVAPKPDTLPRQGDKVTVPLLNGEEVTVEVKSSKVVANGDYTWSGHLEGYGEDYPVVVTYGKHTTFAMITTPQGAYSMESVDGSGWLYKNPAEAELSTPGQEDFIEPPMHEHYEHTADNG